MCNNIYLFWVLFVLLLNQAAGDNLYRSICNNFYKKVLMFQW